MERAERGRDCGRGGVVRCGRGQMGWTLLPLLKKTSSQDEEMPDSCPSQTHERKIQSQRQRAPRPPRAAAHGRASHAGRPRVEPAPAPPAAEAVLRRGGEYYADGQGCYVCVFFLFSFLLSPSLSLLSFGRRVADAFPLLIALAYFLWVLGYGDDVPAPWLDEQGGGVGEYDVLQDRVGVPVRWCGDAPFQHRNVLIRCPSRARQQQLTAYLARRRRKTAKNSRAFTHACWCCYRTLYFDTLPDTEPTQQVNRIAKNTIECKLTFFFIYFIFLRSRCWRPLRVLMVFFFAG